MWLTKNGQDKQTYAGECSEYMSLFTTSVDGNLRGFVPAFSRVLHPSTEAKIYAVVRSLSLY